jgi:MFS family permease
MRGGHRLTLALLCVTQFVDVMGVTIAVVALPSIQRDLGFAATNVQWVVSAYALVFAGFLVVAGRAADVYGRRRLLQTGLAVFTVGSLGCGLAGSPFALVAARGVQGLGAAIAVPAALSLLTATFPEPATRARALGAWTAAAAGGGASGFVVGGLIVDAAGWEWVFLVNVPIALTALLATRFVVVRDAALGSDAHLDLAGAVTVTAGLVLVVYGLSAVQHGGLGSGAVIASLAAGAGALILFAAIERRVAAPLAPRRVVTVRALAAACLIGAVLTAVTSPASVLATVYLQEVLGYGPSRAGLTLLPFSLAVIVGSLGGSAFVSRRGPRTVVVGGLVAVIAAMAVATAISPAGGVPYLVAGLALGGVGLGAASVAATGIGVAAVDSADEGLASGLLNTAAQVGTAIGLALLLAIAGTGGVGGETDGAAAVDGIRLGFAAAGGLAAAGLAAALALLFAAGRGVGCGGAAGHGRAVRLQR